MNLVLLEPEDLQDGLWRLSGRRARHVVTVHRVQPGDALRVGIFRGRIGRATVVSVAPDEVVLDAILDEEPPPRSPVDLLLAMPRPKVLRRVLQAASSMGVSRVVLLNAARVEKSYFDSPFLAEESLSEELRLGLEQGRDTVPPEVLVRRRFRPFVEDELDAFFPSEARLLAHPTPDDTKPPPGAERGVIAVGPEGGWVPFEVELFERRGFRPLSLGPRPLRVEVAVPALVASVELLLR